MSLYKNLPTLTLLLSLTASPAFAEGEQTAYFPSCTDTQLKEGAYCLAEAKNKSGETVLVLNQRDHKEQRKHMTGKDANGTTISGWVKTGGVELIDDKTNKKDIYRAFKEAKVDIFRGLKDCSDTSLKQNDYCIYNYRRQKADLPSGVKGNIKSNEKFPHRIGMVTGKENGKNKYEKILYKADLLAHAEKVGIKFAVKGAENQAAENKENQTTQATSQQGQQAQESKSEVPAEEIQSETKTAGSGEECDSSAKQHLVASSTDQKHAADVQRYLEIQGKLTAARLHYAFFHQISKNNKKFDYSNMMLGLENQIAALVKEKNDPSLKSVHDAFERAPLTNHLDTLLKDKKFENLMQNQVELANNKPHVSLGVSDMKYLSWASEGQEKSSVLEFSDKVNNYISSNDGTKNVEIAAMRDKLDTRIANISSGIVSAKVACQKTAKCDTLSPNTDLVRGSITSILNFWNNQKLDDNNKLALLRVSDSVGDIKNYKQTALASNSNKSTSTLERDGDGAKDTQALTEKVEKKSGKTSTSSVGGGRIPAGVQQTTKALGDIPLDELERTLGKAKANDVFKVGTANCSIKVKSIGSTEGRPYADVVLDDGNTQQDHRVYVGNEASYTTLGKFHHDCFPEKVKAAEAEAAKQEAENDAADKARLDAVAAKALAEKKAEWSGGIQKQIKNAILYATGKGTGGPANGKIGDTHCYYQFKYHDMTTPDGRVHPRSAFTIYVCKERQCGEDNYTARYNSRSNDTVKNELKGHKDEDAMAAKLTDFFFRKTYDKCTR